VLGRAGKDAGQKPGEPGPLRGLHEHCEAAADQLPGLRAQLHAAGGVDLVDGSPRVAEHVAHRRMFEQVLVAFVGPFQLQVDLPQRLVLLFQFRLMDVELLGLCGEALRQLFA
jgi:hypothetical protein